MRARAAVGHAGGGRATGGGDSKGQPGAHAPQALRVASPA